MRLRLITSRPATAAAALCALITVFGVTTSAAASGTERLSARAEGQLVSQEPCEDAPLICQTAVVTGQVTHIGRITGVLFERIDPVSGVYTGKATFTTPNGDTFTTAYTGQAFPPDPNGTVSFLEWHELVDGTGRFEEAHGTLDVDGSASTTGAITIVGTGTLDR